jgi:hypothetical protein
MKVLSAPWLLCYYEVIPSCKSGEGTLHLRILFALGLSKILRKVIARNDVTKCRSTASRTAGQSAILFAAFFDCAMRPLRSDEQSFIGTPPLEIRGGLAERNACEIEMCNLKVELPLQI